MAVADGLVKSAVLVALLAVGPCLAAGFGSWRTVAGVGGYSFALTLLLIGPDDLLTDGRLGWDDLALLLITVISGLLAERRLAQDRLTSSVNQRFGRVFGSVATGLVLVRSETTAREAANADRLDVNDVIEVIEVNAVLRALFRWPDGPAPPPVLELLRAAAVASETPVEIEVSLDLVTSISIRLSALVLPGESALRLIQVQDITSQRRAEQQLTRQALYDSLTGLPSRLLLTDRTRQALVRSGRSGQLVGLMFLDLDRFKNINDSLGHDAGDAVLIEVATRLQTVVRPQDTLARLGGDEFVVVLDGIDAADPAEELLAVAQRLQEALRRPIPAGGGEVYVSASIGLAVGEDSSATLGSLLRDADTAMYRAKEHGRARFQLFDEGLRARAVHRLGVESDLHRALARDELRLHLQPIVKVSDGQVTGAEALVRWQHPDRGLLAPSAFIAVAEDSTLIVAIGDWVLAQAAQAAIRWRHDRADPDFAVSVNISARQLADRQFPDRVVGTLSHAGLAAEHLVLELTESVYTEAIASTVRSLQNLRATGVQLAVDDFGTGYSSLTSIRQYPFDRLKIDKSFVTTMTTDTANAKIVKGVLSLADALGLTCVAEGVETPAAATALAHLGCPLGQGFTWSQPIPVQAFLALPETLSRSQPGR